MKKKLLILFFALFLFITRVDALTKSVIDITTMDVYDIIEALDKGFVSSETLVKLYLERIEKYDDKFNAMNMINKNAINEAKELDKKRANGEIVGRLHGIPIVVKSNIDVKGIPTTGGTKALRKNFPINDSYVVNKLRKEGAIIIGSTNMSELAFSASNSYSSYGYVKNVFNPMYTPYGSSGGSAVAVTAGFAAAALGTDTNSSIRLPASGAGLVGMRPTLGLVSRGGVIPYDIERDTVGVLSRSVRDNQLILDVIKGSDPKDKITKRAINAKVMVSNTSLKGVKVGVITQYVKGSSRESGVTGPTDKEILDKLNESIKILKDNGAEIIYLDKFVKNSNINIAHTTYAGGTMCDNFDEYIKGTNGPIKSFKGLASNGGHVQSLDGYVNACGRSNNLKSERDSKKKIYRDYVTDYFNDYDLDIMLYPTLKNRVFKYNQSGNISPGSSFGSVIGFPSITVPMGFISDGFSYGIEFLSLPYNESKLYNVSLEYEKLNGNKINTSPLTPSLYEIPDCVNELKKLYLNELNNINVFNKKWLDDCKNLFINYNDIKDIDNKVAELITEHSKLGLCGYFGIGINDFINLFIIVSIGLLFIAFFKKLSKN